MQDIEIVDLGTIEYNKAYDLQKNYVQMALEENKGYLLVCEHPAVLTLGRTSKKEHLLISEKELHRREIELISIDRGGDITLHCPGQLVVYPIVDLNYYKKDLHYHLFQLEEVIIELLKDFGIVATRSEINTGAWVGNRKIASIGIGVRKWITYHGLALNVNTPLELFNLIKPCGLDVQMTSMAEIKGHEFNIEEVKEKLIDKFMNIFTL